MITPDHSVSALELGPISPVERSGSSENVQNLAASEHSSASDDRAHADASSKCQNNGAQMCASDSKNKYLECAKGKWSELSCKGSTVCTQTSADKVTCGKADAESKPTPSTQVKCDTDGATMCNASAKTGYFQCVKNVWQQMTCDKGTECRTSNNKAICADPNAPIESNAPAETKIACDTDKATMCDKSDKASFYMCIDKYWTKMKCDGDNVCMARDGKTACVDQATANAPVQPCSTANATQCVSDNQKIFQICIGNYWTNSTCADNNYCLQRGDQAVCVDKATAEAPVLPCTTANATRCIDGAETKYQLCYDGFWTNATCDKGNVCGMKKDIALCHDPSQPIVEDQPCDVDKATRCVAGNETLYQVCSKNLWMNLTCDGNNICRLDDNDNVMCVDKDEAYLSLTMATLHEPTPYRGNISLGISTRDIYSWGISAILAAVMFALGISI
ncbi:hypothetical protein LPJ55_003653 [Coemansia sp. RSA 990]|nr:hypothetical protein LPJ68_004146 [Coemansia sp. RSA 1086]KAJ1748469.1 hypothetical protein LPJ79_004493 [Coemansia sp. RSA 1821]KAJ1871761.1 hypothetical protein LPJ55_003653 [Coemansia sp. RSA 990]